MFFKRQVSALSVVGVLALTVFSACTKGLPTGGTGMQLSTAEMGCLSKVGAITEKFLDGRASESETAEMGNCAVRSLQLFDERTRGEAEGFYSPGELRAFLEKYFLVDTKISDSFLREAMELKRALLGGKVDALTHDEIRRALTLIRIVRDQMLRLRPFMPLYPAAASERSEEQIQAAVAALRAAAGAMGAALESAGVPYSFSRIDQLLEAAGVFTAGNLPLFERIRARLPAFRLIKATLIAPSADFIAANEWSTLLDAGVRWYGLFLQFSALSRGSEDWSESSRRERLMALLREGFDLLEGAINRHPQGLISFEELDHLMDGTLPEQVSIFGRTVPRSHLKIFSRPLIRKMMGGFDRGPTGQAALGLTKPALARTWKIIEHWAEGERFIEEYLVAPQEAFSIAHSAGRSVVYQDASARLRQMIIGDRPLFLGDDEQITYSGYPGGTRHSRRGLSRMNLIYEIARTLYQGYSGDYGIEIVKDDRYQAVTLAEFRVFCDDIRDIAVDTKFLDPYDLALAEKRFREASLFTFPGNGDSYLSIQEAAHLVALMYSGKVASSQMHAEIIAAGCLTGEMDIYGYRLIDAACYRNELFFNVEHFWERMPQLVSYYRGLDSQRQAAFRRSMEDGARKQGYSGAMMNSSDTEGFSMIAQYVEVIFSRFDLDNSGELNWKEANAAFPVFKSTLKEMSCGQGHCLSETEDLHAVFTYMLAYGEAPSPVAFFRWRYFPFFRSLSADRGRILDIFAAIGRTK